MGLYCDPTFQTVEFGDGRRVQQFVTSVFATDVLAPETLAGNDEATAWNWFYPQALPDDLLPYARRWLTDALTTQPSTIVS